MDSIQLMMEEHKYIKRALAVIRKMCVSVLNTGEVPFEDFKSVIGFVRNYADKHHHGKEEDILFKKMKEELGEAVIQAPLSGMLIEHDLGRLFIGSLEQALERVKGGDKESRVDVIANAIGYTDLLNRHIDKEDKVIYTFAKKALKEEAIKEIDEKCENLEERAQAENIQRYYIEALEQLENSWR